MRLICAFGRQWGRPTPQPSGVVPIRRNQSRYIKTVVLTWVNTKVPNYELEVHRHPDYCATSRPYDIDPTRRPWQANLSETLKIYTVVGRVMTQHSAVSEEPASYPQNGGWGWGRRFTHTFDNAARCNVLHRHRLGCEQLGC